MTNRELLHAFEVFVAQEWVPQLPQLGHEVPRPGRGRPVERKRGPRGHQGHQGKDALLARPRDGPRPA
eukprot:12853062-Alexandrium_andersonii.AAC.1